MRSQKGQEPAPRKPNRREQASDSRSAPGLTAEQYLGPERQMKTRRACGSKQGGEGGQGKSMGLTYLRRYKGKKGSKGGCTQKEEAGETKKSVVLKNRDSR